MLINLLRKIFKYGKKQDKEKNSDDYFRFNNKILTYNKIPYNNSAERMVEIPISFDFLYKNLIKNKKFFRSRLRILEVGNVLSNYENLLNAYLHLDQRDILDKFEIGPRIKNIDLMDFDENNEYDLIISISTVEHIGQLTDPSGKYGEKDLQRDREAPLKAIIKIYNLLKKGGKALITVPFGKLTDLGWLIQFDEKYFNLLITKYKVPREAVTVRYLKRVSMNQWVECESEDLSQTEFHYPYPYANGIAVIYLEKVRREEIPIIFHSPTLTTSLQYYPPVLIGNLYSNGLILACSLNENGSLMAIKKGFIFYGPYLQLEAGKYELQLRLKVSQAGDFVLDVTSNFGSKILWQTTFKESVEMKHVLCLSQNERDVEIRLFNNSDKAVEFFVEKIYFRKQQE